LPLLIRREKKKKGRRFKVQPKPKGGFIEGGGAKKEATMATKAVNVYQEIKVCLVTGNTTKVTSLLHVEKPRRMNIILLPFIVFKRHEFVALTTGSDPCAILAQVASKS
jgi:hypothetical protein